MTQKWKRILSALLCVAMLAGYLPGVSVHAEEAEESTVQETTVPEETEAQPVSEEPETEEEPSEPEEPSESEDPSEPEEAEAPAEEEDCPVIGDGSQDAPYAIASGEELAQLAAAEPDAWFCLAADIELPEVWTPIGTEEQPFRGHFDGNGYAIRGLRQVSGAYAGLFGVAQDAVITGVALEDADVDAYGAVSAGIVIGKMIGGSLTQSYAAGKISGGDTLGGLVGTQLGGTVSDCFAAADAADAGCAGGLVGLARAGASIVSCYSIGYVSGNYADALCGDCDDTVTLEGCYGVDAVSSFGTFLTREEAAQESSFADLDFTLWQQGNGEGYPYPVLRNHPFGGGSQWMLPVERATGYVYMEDQKVPASADAAATANASFPSSYKTPNLPAVRNQGSFGTCWAHSMAAGAEINMIKKGYASPSSINLSELQFVWANYMGPLKSNGTYNDPLDNFGGDHNIAVSDGTEQCYLDQGGNYTLAARAAASWMGFMQEDSLTAYNTSNMKAASANGLPYAYAFDKDVVHLENIREISMDSGVDVIKQAILDYGAVSINYNASSVFTTNNERYYYCSETYNTNHAVIIVGWDDSISKSYFRDSYDSTAPSRNGAWIVRNSWGSDWGDKGYFYMSYETSFVSSDYYVGFAWDYDKSDNYDLCYQYDGSESAAVYGFNANTLYQANVFTAAEDGTLSAVSFWSEHMADLSFKVYVYTGLTKSNNPASGTLACTVSGKTNLPGYYTIWLSKDVQLTRGQKFSVVVQFTGESYYYFDVDTTVDYNWTKAYSYAASGQSFYSENGTDWDDLGAEEGANVRIKAFTKSKTACTNHSYSYAVTKAPTAAASGTLTGTCSKCGAVTTVTLPVLDMVSYTYQEIKAPTVTETGTGRYTWKNTTYGTYYFDVTLPKLVEESHSYSYAVTKAPTAAASGTLTGTCSKCGDVTTVTLPVLDTVNYTYQEIKAPTVAETGTGRYTWKNTTYGTYYFDVTLPKLIDESDVDSGKCGDNLTWVLSRNGVLTISGTGKMYDYETAPWDEYSWDIKAVVLPAGLTTIGNRAFAWCVRLTKVVIPDGVTAIGWQAFYECYSMTEIVLPKSVRTIGDGAFDYCSDLTEITLPSGIQTIGRDTFEGCSSLTEVIVPDGVQTIGAWAFNGCSSLTYVELPVSLKLIDYAAFYDCRRLQEVRYHGSVAQWNDVNVDSWLNEYLLDALVCRCDHSYVFTGSRSYAKHELRCTLCGERVTEAHTLSGNTCTVCGVNVDTYCNLSVTAPEKLTGSQTKTLTVEMRGEEFPMDRTVLWSLRSEDTAFASIDAKGKLTTKEVFTPTVIQVTAAMKADADIAETVTITLVPKMTSVKLTPEPAADKVILVDWTWSNTVQLEVNPVPATASKAGTWKSSSTAIATVKDGLVTFKKPGLVTITFTASDGSKKTASVKVRAGVPVDSIAIFGESTLGSGKKTTLQAMVNSDASVKTLAWSVSDTSVATVSSKGVVTAKTVYEQKTVYVTAKATDGSGVSETVELTVKPSSTVLPIYYGGEMVSGKTITVDFTPYMSVRLYGDSTKWSGSNNKVAVVYDSGQKDGAFVYFQDKPGTVTVTAKNGTATGKVTIKAARLVQGLNINVKSGSDVLVSGKGKVTLTAVPTNSNATSKAVTWKSSDTSAATVSTSGVVTAKAGVQTPTKVTITATAKDGSGKYAEKEITVLPLSAGVTISAAEAFTTRDGIAVREKEVLNNRTLKVDINQQSMVYLTAGTYPAGANQAVTWKSSSTKIAKVDANGTVTLVGTGTVTLTATAKDGSGKKSTVKLTVVRYADELENNTASYWIAEGKKLTLKVTPKASNGGKLTSTALTYTLRDSDKAWASVSTSGVLTAKKGSDGHVVEVTVTYKEDPSLYMKLKFRID